ncbi:DUF4333 domain-containing protein [Mycobacterium sp. PDNC021]|uniref:DUF4333 domain-containing protein n=1 Tax=Mycobacterium sp. PDNC021 TaxID=3391399 RepID=UPI003AAE9947
MTNTTCQRLVLASAITVAVFGAAACSSGTPSVSKKDVESQIITKMTGADGKKADSVTCPENLAGQKGAEINCTMKVGDKTSTVNVTVTSIEGEQVKFDMVQTIDKDQVAKQISEELGQQFGTKPESLTCPENLKGTEGATLRCELKDSGQTYGVTVTVNKVDGSDVNYGFKVDDKPKS